MPSFWRPTAIRPSPLGPDRNGRLVFQDPAESTCSWWLDAWVHQAPMPGIVDVLMSAIYVMQAKIAKANLERHPPDLLIRPSLGSIRFMDFDRAGEIIELGYQAARSALVGWVMQPAGH
jgi:predicted acylesterase/phospholipase RssA